MLSTNLKSNFLLLLIPSIIPIFLTLIGINQITIYSSNELLKIKSENVFLWFSKDKIKYILVPKLPTVQVKEKSKMLGVKKKLIITTKPKNKSILNVSTLSKKERSKLIEKINNMSKDK